MLTGLESIEIDPARQVCCIESDAMDPRVFRLIEESRYLLSQNIIDPYHRF